MEQKVKKIGKERKGKERRKKKKKKILSVQERKERFIPFRKGQQTTPIDEVDHPVADGFQGHIASLGVGGEAKVASEDVVVPVAPPFHGKDFPQQGPEVSQGRVLHHPFLGSLQVRRQIGPPK